jgi:protein-tyrosine kinase
MEKLQKALQKARDQRAGAPVHGTVHSGRTMPQGAVEDAVAAPQPVDELWTQLRSFEPTAANLERGRIVSAEANKLGTHFDILRTKVMLMMRKNGWKRLAITSPTMGCGKSTTACNLVVGGARNQDFRMILVELDLRRPSIAKTLGIPDGPDVTELLSGKVGFAEQALRYRDNIALAVAQRASADPTSILLSRTTHEVLNDIEARYEPDVMIFDLPPILVSDDTQAVLKDVDCALLVARAGSTTVTQIDSSEREIAEQTNMLGVVLNQCRDADESYDYYE